MAVSAIINCWLGKWRPSAKPTDNSASLDIQLVESALSETIVITVAKNKIMETDATVFTRPTCLWFCFIRYWYFPFFVQWTLPISTSKGERWLMLLGLPKEWDDLSNPEPHQVLWNPFASSWLGWSWIHNSMGLDRHKPSREPKREKDPLQTIIFFSL